MVLTKGLVGTVASGFCCAKGTWSSAPPRFGVRGGRYPAPDPPSSARRGGGHLLPRGEGSTPIPLPAGEGGRRPGEGPAGAYGNGSIVGLTIATKPGSRKRSVKSNFSPPQPRPPFRRPRERSVLLRAPALRAFPWQNRGGGSNSDPSCAIGSVCPRTRYHVCSRRPWVRVRRGSSRRAWRPQGGRGSRRAGASLEVSQHVIL